MNRDPSKLAFRLAVFGFLVCTYSCSEIVQPEDATPPRTPANFTLIGGGDGEAHFRWTSNTEPDFDKYRIYRSINPADLFSALAELRQTQYVDRFLDYDTTYYYYVTALDFAGNESPPSPILDVQPLNISSPPQPTNLVVTGTNNPSLSRQEMNLVWFPPNISDLMHFRIFRGPDSTFVTNQSTLIDSNAVSVYTDQNIQPGISYYYKIIAVDRGYKVSNASKPDGDRLLPSPTLISPANQTIFTPPFVFTFSGVANAVNYQVFLGEAPLTGVIWASGKTADTQVAYNGPQLVSDRIYYWWVAAFSRTVIVREDGTQLEAPPNSFSIVNRFFVE